ncbi:hypothetical protein Ciccas_011773 [Cichlidogyrus casuarinus]|uniref:Uncharacterized protein n=1 Tax=Cichlidogyrus casuarinus TaxID=1844966 RepID=A0ABD2PRM3_9PLAT
MNGFIFVVLAVACLLNLVVRGEAGRTIKNAPSCELCWDKSHNAVTCKDSKPMVIEYNGKMTSYKCPDTGEVVGTVL